MDQRLKKKAIDWLFNQIIDKYEVEWTKTEEGILVYGKTKPLTKFHYDDDCKKIVTNHRYDITIELLTEKETLGIRGTISGHEEYEGYSCPILNETEIYLWEKIKESMQPKKAIQLTLF